MSTYLWLKLVHVLAAIVAVGTNVTYFAWLRWARSDTAQAAQISRGIKALDSRLAAPAYVVLPVTGILMVLDGHIGFTTFWVAMAIGLYVALGVVAGIFFSPALRRQVVLAETAGTSPAEYDAAARRTIITGPSR